MTKTARELYALSYRLERENDRLFFEELATEPNTPEYGTVTSATHLNARLRHDLADDCYSLLGSCDVVYSAGRHLRERRQSKLHYVGQERSIHQRISAREPGHYLTEMICRKWAGRPSPFQKSFVTEN